MRPPLRGPRLSFLAVPLAVLAAVLFLPQLGFIRHDFLCFFRRNGE